MIDFVPATDELIRQLAADMRPEDAREVWASHRHTPIEALRTGWYMSDLSAVVVADGVPLAMLGLVKGDILTGSGVVWLLGANEALKHKREFLKHTDRVIGEMLRVCPRLYNYVHAKNKSSVRWLKRIGFTIGDPVPLGPDEEMFHPFKLER